MSGQSLTVKTMLNNDDKETGVKAGDDFIHKNLIMILVMILTTFHWLPILL